MKALLFYGLIILLLNLSSIKTVAQINKEVGLVIENLKELTIGDKVPDIEFTLLNSPSRFARLSDFRGKLIIIDFWATWCGSCLRQFHKLDSLKGFFNEKLQILLVNSKGSGDDENKIIKLFEKRRDNNGSKYTLPTAVNDSVAVVLFPHLSIPHYVWIDHDQRVLAITEYIDTKDVYAAINNETIKAPIKKDFEYDFHSPLFFNNNGGVERNVQYRSYLTGYLDGVPGVMGMEIDSNRMVTNIHNTNTSILNLYRQAYPEISDIPANGIILDVKNPSKFSPDDFDSFVIWKYKNTHSYELMIPPTPKEKALEFMREDLMRYFGLTIKKEKRMMKVFVLSFSGKPQKVVSKGGEMNTNIYIGDIPVVLQNYPFGTLVSYLNNSKIFKYPVLDETNVNFTVDMIFPDHLSNFGSFVATLNKYGFQVKEQVRELEVVVISDK